MNCHRNELWVSVVQNVCLRACYGDWWEDKAHGEKAEIQYTWLQWEVEEEMDLAKGSLDSAVKAETQCKHKPCVSCRCWMTLIVDCA